MAVEGPSPGDAALRIDLLEFQPAAWGWTASIPGFGLLADDCPDPLLRGHVRLEAGAGRVSSQPGIGGSRRAVVGYRRRANFGPAVDDPPDVYGGNMDTATSSPGSTLFLPVFSRGARLSAGATAALGGSEVWTLSARYRLACLTVRRTFTVRRRSSRRGSARRRCATVTAMRPTASDRTC